MDTPEKPKLKVTDRRQFTRDGEKREEAVAAAEERRSSAPQRAQVEPDAASLGIDFSQLILSLARQALMLLGEERNPLSGRPEPDLDAARETIDILMLLRVKTRGNLTRDEDSLLGQMIYELQMKYSQKTKA